VRRWFRGDENTTCESFEWDDDLCALNDESFIGGLARRSTRGESCGSDLGVGGNANPPEGDRVKRYPTSCPPHKSGGGTGTSAKLL
jgi:hypothetical protein